MPREQHADTRQSFFRMRLFSLSIPTGSDCVGPSDGRSNRKIFNVPEIFILATERSEMNEKRGRGRPKFEPTQDQRSQVKMMKAVGIPEDQICKQSAAAAQRSTPQPAQTVPQPGSMEWSEAQKKG